MLTRRIRAVSAAAALGAALWVVHPAGAASAHPLGALAWIATTADDSRPLPDGHAAPREPAPGRARDSSRPGHVGPSALCIECSMPGRPDPSPVVENAVSRRPALFPAEALPLPPGDRSTAPHTPFGSPAPDAGTPSGLHGEDHRPQTLITLVTRRDLAVGFAALALSVSVLLGAVHALAPGHGNTLMAVAAAAGDCSSLRDVLALAASATAIHSTGVLILGALITAGSAAAPSVTAWFGIISGALVTFAGAVLLRRALRLPSAYPPPHSRPYPYDRAHPNDHVHANDHSHPHGHPHHHLLHSNSRGVVLAGFVDGLAPSPAAVVVMAGASALGQAWFGFLLVLVHTVGLALTLAAAGFASARLDWRPASRIAVPARPLRHRRLRAVLHRATPIGTAGVVFVIGCGLLRRWAATTLG